MLMMKTEENNRVECTCGALARCVDSAGVETARTTEGGGDGQLRGKAGSLAGNTHRIYLPMLAACSAEIIKW